MGTNCRTWIEGRDARSAVATGVRVPPERAFSYVADLTRHHEWAMNEITVTPVTPGPVRLGSRFQSVGRQLRKERPADLEVTGFDPPRYFAFSATGGPIPSPDGDPHLHEFLLTANNGGTRLELRRRDLGPPSWPGWLIRLAGPLILRSTVRVRVQTVERLRTRLEQLLTEE